jgi:hypothetical protein
MNVLERQSRKNLLSATRMFRSPDKCTEVSNKSQNSNPQKDDLLSLQLLSVTHRSRDNSWKREYRSKQHSSRNNASSTSSRDTRQDDGAGEF